MRMEKFQSDSSNSFPVCNFFFLKEICSDEEKCVFKRDFLKRYWWLVCPLDDGF